ncbi:sensitivity to red-light reduced protein [Podila epicladia]|nr:sensitivity to red-light reduced protein [Podila epicladia]KAG0096296.1 sensitivity to red-light reduced protein [Podila epicladia]
MASFKEQADEQIPEEEPFTFVTRKGKGKNRQTAAPSQRIKAPTPQFQEPAVNLPGWSTPKPAKIKKNSQRAKMMGSRGIEAEKKTIEWGLNMIEERKSTLMQSKFFMAFQELVQLTLFPPCKKQASKPLQDTTPVDSETPPKTEETNSEISTGAPTTDQGSDNATAALQDSRQIKNIICYGIGSIESSRNSQFQLALGLCLKEVLKISGTISIFDPIMTAFDQQLAETLGLEVIKVNDQAKQVLQQRTLMYMPHCPKGLYSHVLESNWSREQLDNLVVLGNRFTMYDENPSFKHYAKQAPFILPALSIAEVTLLPATKFEDNTIFNDLAFHRFPPQHNVPEVDLQDREEDPEML